MDDNDVRTIPSISEQLLRRRKRLGLSLADVAARAGTSAATLSRYENGWTRFETYTLKKLASALGCELRLTLKPLPVRATARASPAVAVRQVRRLFWDRKLSAEDLAQHPVWVVERVLDYGSLQDVHALQRAWGRKTFLETVAQASRLSPRTHALWQQVLRKEGVACTKKYSRPTAWNS